MTEDIKVPGLGNTKKTYLIVAGVAAGGYVLYRWMNREDTSASEEVPVIEPTTEEYGGSGSTGSAGTDYWYPSSSDTTAATATIGNNQQWTQAGVAYADSLGWDSGAAALALGKFLRSEPLTSSQQDIVKAILGAVGNPPSGGPYTVITDTTSSSGKLPAPTGLGSSTIASNSVRLKWNSVSGAKGYYLYRTDSTEGIGYSGDTQYLVQGLDSGKTYKFQVAAYDSNGTTGAKSSVYTVKTTTIALKAPTGVKVVSTTRDRATVKWNAVAGADSYRIYVDGFARGSSDDSTQFTIFGLLPNRSYKITVKADAQNQTPGPLSGAVTAKTKK